MSTIRIGFRSGQELVLEVDKLTVEKSRSDNRVSAISWTGGPHLLYMALDQIDYVIEPTGRAGAASAIGGVGGSE